MSDEDEFMQKARTGFEDLCRALNMDEEASNEAWKSYENISRNYTLEVNIYVRYLLVVLLFTISAFTFSVDLRTYFRFTNCYSVLLFRNNCRY